MKLVSESAAPESRVAVVKIGGSILTGPQAYRRAAEFVAARSRAKPDERLVIVVSAEDGATDSLLRTARDIVVAQPEASSLDLLWSTGELRSVALLALHLQSLGVAAAPLNIHQSGLAAPEDDCQPGRVRVNTRGIAHSFARCRIAIVPGFLAVDASGGVVSLGRGGSDLTAVLLAEALGACRCELIKDVPGYFTADPHRDPSAQPIAHLTFDRALAMADAGCDLVQRKAIDAAAACGLPLVVRTLDDRAASTLISSPVPLAGWLAASLAAEAAS